MWFTIDSTHILSCWSDMCFHSYSKVCTSCQRATASSSYCESQFFKETCQTNVNLKNYTVQQKNGNQHGRTPSWSIRASTRDCGFLPLKCLAVNWRSELMSAKWAEIIFPVRIHKSSLSCMEKNVHCAVNIVLNTAHCVSTVRLHEDRAVECVFMSFCADKVSSTLQEYLLCW